MKSTIFTLLAAFIVASSIGCAGMRGGNCGPNGCSDAGCDDCAECESSEAPDVDTSLGVTHEGKAICSTCGPACKGHGLGDRLRGLHGRKGNGGGGWNGKHSYAPGPPSGGVTYPYYTTRGPRDFLARDPRSPGP